MRFTCPLDANSVTLLKSAGFKQRRNVFLRIHGDGILQCIFRARDPSAKESTLCISVRSVYEPNVFGDTSIYQGALTYPYEIEEFVLGKITDSSNYGLLRYVCIPELNCADTQKSFHELISSLETRRFGSVRWYMDMITIPSFLALGQYELALQKCNMVLSHNDDLINVRKMRSIIMTEDVDLIDSFLNETRSRNMQQYAALKFK